MNTARLRSIILAFAFVFALGQGCAPGWFDSLDPDAFDKTIQSQALARSEDPDCGGLTFSREKLSVENVTQILRCFNSKGDLVATVQAWESLPRAVQSEWVSLFHGYLLQDSDGVGGVLASWQTAKRLQVVGPFFEGLTEFLGRRSTQTFVRDFFKGANAAEADALDAFVKMAARLAGKEFLWSELPRLVLARGEVSGLFAALEKSKADFEQAAPALRTLIRSNVVTAGALEEVLTSDLTPYLKSLTSEETSTLLALFSRLEFPLKCGNLTLSGPTEVLEMLGLKQTAPFVLLALQPACGFDFAALRDESAFSFPAFAGVATKLADIKSGGAAFGLLAQLSVTEQSALRSLLQSMSEAAPLRSYLDLFQESGWLPELAGLMGSDANEIASLLTPERLRSMTDFFLENRETLANFLAALSRFQAKDPGHALSSRFEKLSPSQPWFKATWTHFANREVNLDLVTTELHGLAENGKLVSFVDYFMRLVSPELRMVRDAETLVSREARALRLSPLSDSARFSAGVVPACFEDRAKARALLTKNVTELASAFGACTSLEASAWQHILKMGAAFLGALKDEGELFSALSVFDSLKAEGGLEPVLLRASKDRSLKSIDTLISLFPVAGPYLKEPEFFSMADGLATLLVRLELESKVEPATLRFLRKLSTQKMDRGFRALADKYSTKELVGFLIALGEPVDGVMGHESVFARIERWLLVFPELTVPLISRFMRAPSIENFDSTLEQFARNFAKASAGPRLEARLLLSLSLFDGLRPFVRSSNGLILQDLFLAVATSGEHGPIGGRPSQLKLVRLAAEAGLLSQLGAFIQTLSLHESETFYAVLEAVLAHPEFLTEVSSDSAVMGALAKILVSMTQADGRALLHALEPLVSSGPGEAGLYRWISLATRLLKGLPADVSSQSADGDAVLKDLYPLAQPILNWLSQPNDVAARVRLALSRALRLM